MFPFCILETTAISEAHLCFSAGWIREDACKEIHEQRHENAEENVWNTQTSASTYTSMYA